MGGPGELTTSVDLSGTIGAFASLHPSIGRQRAIGGIWINPR